MSEDLNVPDYITLYKSDASVSGNSYTWNVPQTYYNNARGSICYVSLADVIMTSPNGEEVVVLLQSSQNAETTKNNGSVLGLLPMAQGTGNGHLSYNNSQPINLLVQARPSSITLTTTTLDNTSHIPTNAIFVLKFVYLPIKEAIMDYKNSEYLPTNPL